MTLKILPYRGYVCQDIFRKRHNLLRRHIILSQATTAELEKKAADGKQRAAKAEEPVATELEREARLYPEGARVSALLTVGIININGKSPRSIPRSRD
jgi:hypothetical protein